MITQELITAFTLGLIGGLIPGPVITAVFTEILQSGIKHALRIIVIAFIVETAVAVISLLIFSYAGFSELFFRVLSIFGAAILAWIASSLWRVKSLDTGQKVVFSLWKITLMILTNGVLWTYWITICIPKAIFLKESLHFGDYLFMGLVQGGWLTSTLIVAFVFSRFRTILSKPGIIPYAFKFFALVFIYFAVDMLIKSILFFLG
ncbi:hypothetical protein ACFLT1_04000 [Bacteroidota bacterium]